MFKSLIILVVSAACSNAAVITNTNINLSSGGGGFPEYDYSLTINQYPVYSDPTSIFFDRQDDNLIFRAYNLDEGSDWYFSNLNDTFNAYTISQGAFTAFNALDQSYLVGYGDFYLGVNTSFGMQPEPGRAIFGWALLRNSATGLELLGSGVSYDVPGIIIGTTMVPEPSAALPASIALIPLLLSRRRSTKPKS